MKIVRLFLMGILGILGALCSYGYYAQFYKWRGCFNEAGRCFDPDSGLVYHTQSGPAWMALAILFFGIAFVIGLYHIKYKRRV